MVKPATARRHPCKRDTGARILGENDRMGDAGVSAKAVGVMVESQCHRQRPAQSEPYDP